MNLSLIATCALAVCLTSCLENEEEITVHPNGSVSVRMSAKGKPDDLADGYSVPLRSPWVADSETTNAWLRDVGSDTGSPIVRDRLRQLAPGSSPLATDQDVGLAVRANFASVEELPRWVASDSEPYRTAYLQRGTRLDVESKSGRRVFTFERVFHAREWERRSSLFGIEERIPKPLREKLDRRDDDESIQLTDSERDQLIEIGTSALTEGSMRYAEDALLSVFTAGDASLDPRAVERVLQSVRSSISSVINHDCLATIVDLFLAGSESNESDDDEFAKLESTSRETLRTSLDAALAKERVFAPTRNAVRGHLEWTFTAFDHTSDLGDESFKVVVHMPGVVVGGNYDAIEGGRVSWKFDGLDLADRDRVLRVVSVLD